jgi:hypothetical protein
LRRVLWVGLIVAVLHSCGAQPTVQNNASGEEDPVEGTAPVEETTRRATSARVGEPDPEPVEGPASRNTTARPAVGTNGMVSSAHPLATKVGLNILADGGNAFDAAVAVAAALNVVEPMMSGIGGYGAIVLYDADKDKTRFLHAGPGRIPPADPKLPGEPAECQGRLHTGQRERVEGTLGGVR